MENSEDSFIYSTHAFLHLTHSSNVFSNQGGRKTVGGGVGGVACVCACLCVGVTYLYL